MAEKEDDLEFDFDTDMDDLDIDPFSSNNEDVPDDRSPATKVAASALDSVLSQSTARTVAKALRDHALPEGYKQAAYAADDALGAAKELYDSAGKELKPAKEALQKAIRDNGEKIDAILPEWMASAVKGLGGRERDDVYVDPQEAEIAASLSNVFSQYQQQQTQVNAAEAGIAEGESVKEDARHQEQLASITPIADGVSRIVGYQDAVLINYQRKSLELQHRQFFATRDMLELARAGWVDQKTLLQAINKNTGLPDVQKLRATENLGQMFENQMLGELQGNIHDYGMNLTRNIRENIMVQVKDRAAGINDAVTSIMDMAAMMGGSDMEEMGLSKEDMAGSMLAESGAGWLTQKAAKPILKFLNSNERIGEGSQQLMYYLQNFPDLLNEWVKSGRTFGDSMMLDSIQEAVKSVIPTFSEEFTPTTNLHDNAMDAMPFDRLAHRSIVEIMPDYLSRILQQVTAFNTGELGDRLVFDTRQERMMGAREQEANLLNKLVSEDTTERNRVVADEVVSSIKGTDTLSDAAREALRDQILNDRARGHTAFSADRYKQYSWWDNADTSEELTEFFQNNSISWGEHNTLSGKLKGIQTINQDLRREMRGANKVANLDVFRRLGLIDDNNRPNIELIEQLNRTGKLDDRAVETESVSPGRRLWDRSVSESPLPPIGEIPAVPQTITPTLDISELSELLTQQHAANRESIRSYFQMGEDNILRLPTLPPEIAPGEPGNAMDSGQALIDSINGNFETTHVLLQGITEAIMNGESGSGGVNISAGGILNGLRSGAGKLTDMLSSYYGGLGRIGKASLRTAGDLGSRTLSSAKNAMSRDIYVKGREFPALRADLMRKGFYYDSETDQPVKSLEDALSAEGAVLDRNGNVVLSRDDIQLGLEDRWGVDLGGMVESLAKPIESLWGWQTNLISGALSVPGRIRDSIRERLTSLRDVYVKGESKPRLKAAILKNGGYFSAMTGEPITSMDQIDGDIVDMYGNIVLSMHDMQQGLVDRFGVNIDATGLGGLIADTGKRIFDAGWDFTKGTYRKTGELMGAAGSRLASVGNTVRDWVGGQGQRAQSLYDDISGQALDEYTRIQERMSELGLTWKDLSSMSREDLEAMMPDIDWSQIKATTGDQLRMGMAKAAPLMQSMGQSLSGLSMPDFGGLSVGFSTANETLEEQLSVQKSIYEHLTGNGWIDRREPTAPSGLVDARGNPLSSDSGRTSTLRDRAQRAGEIAGDGFTMLNEQAADITDRLSTTADEILKELDAQTADSREAIQQRIKAARQRAIEMSADAGVDIERTWQDAQTRVQEARQEINDSVAQHPEWKDKLKRGALAAGGLGLATMALGPIAPVAAAGYGLYKGKDYLKDKYQAWQASDDTAMDRLKGFAQSAEVEAGSLRDKMRQWGDKARGVSQEDDGLATLHGTAGEQLSESTDRDEGPLGDEIETGDDVASDVSTKGYLSAQLDALRSLVPEKVAGDHDGDGHRDGSWQQYFSNKGKKKDDDNDPLVVKVDKDEEEEDSWIMKLLGGIGGIVGGGLSTLKDIIFGALAAKFGGKALDAGADLLGDAADVADGPDRRNRNSRSPRGGRRSLLRRGLSKVGQWGKGLLSGGKSLAVRGGMALAGTKVGAAAISAAAPAAATIASTAATVGASAAAAVGTAAAAIAAAPAAVIAGAVLGTAAVGYGVYKAFSYFSGRSDAEPLEGLRFLQYGVNLSDKTFMSHIRDIEDEALDNIQWEGNMPILTEKPSYFFKEFGEDMGVDPNNHDQILQWANWFQKRFAPVFLTHLAVCRALDEDVDLDDIDDEMDDDLKIEFIRRVQFTQKDLKNKTWPYSVLSSPIPNAPVLLNEGMVREYSERLIATLQKDGDADDFDWMPPTVKDDPKKKLAVEQEHERDMQQASRNTTAAERLQGNRLPKPTRPITSAADRLAAKKPTTPAGPGTLVESTTTQRYEAGQMGEGYLSYDDRNLQKPKGGSGKFIVPARGRLSSPYGYRQHPNGSGRKFHKGIDIAAPTGTPVYAAADGVIYRQYRSESYGNVIYIRHADGSATRYAHLHSFADGTGNGVAVKQRQLIGFVGNTGHSFGAHLHFEHRKTTDQWADTYDPTASFPSYDQQAADDLVSEAEAAAKEESKPDKDTLEGYDTLSNTVNAEATGEDDTVQPGVGPSNTAQRATNGVEPADVPNPSGLAPVDVSTDVPSPAQSAMAGTKVPEIRMDEVVKSQSAIGREAAAQRARQLELMEQQAETNRQLLEELRRNGSASRTGGSQRSPEEPEFNRGNRPDPNKGTRTIPRESQPAAIDGVLDLSH